MTSQWISVDAERPQAEAIGRAAEVLRGGGLAAFPTETVYGLGADALSAAAVAKIFWAKGRPATNPVIVHVGDATAAKAVCREWTDDAERLAAAYWPGPLTLVIPKAACVPDVATAGGTTVAVRAPRHAVAQALLAAVGRPIAAPSANRSNRISPTTAAHVAAELGDRIDLLLDGGPCQVGLESTVVDLASSPPRLLRPGGISASELLRYLPDLATPPLDAAGRAVEGTLRSPGQLARHYAPNVPLELVPAESASIRVGELARQGRVGWLSIGTPSRSVGPNVVVVAMPADAAAYGARLYAALRELESSDCERLVAATPPRQEAWRAVRDRLARAAAPADADADER